MLVPIQADFQASKERQERERKVELKPDGHVEGAGKDEVDSPSGAEAATQQLHIKTNGPRRELLCLVMLISSYEYPGPGY